MADSPSRGSNASEDFDPTKPFDLGEFLVGYPGALKDLNDEIGDYDFGDDDGEKKLIGPFDGGLDLKPMGDGVMTPWDAPFQEASQEINQPELQSQPLEAAALMAPPIVNEAPMDNVAPRQDLVEMDVMRGNVKGMPRAPRKYRPKPEHVKQDPVYRTKRERNNVAVRQSRDKAKRAQQEKEERLEFLEQEHIKDKRLIKELQDEIAHMQESCRCGALANYH
ncbi:CCAAT/enhancer-binding protein delta [Aphelenchoides avenae]|nr:CCAAT/enhancer-binding protein delta [Aphelenchus avenae]